MYGRAHMAGASSGSSMNMLLGGGGLIFKQNRPGKGAGGGILPAHGGAL